jgi:hypothetical protein
VLELACQQGLLKCDEAKKAAMLKAAAMAKMKLAAAREQ